MNVEGHNCQASLNLVGYQRSGQHGVASWLMANLPSPSVFLNNLGPMGADELWYVDEKRVDSPPGKDPVVVVRGLEGCYRRSADSNFQSIFVVRDIKNHIASIIRHPRFSPEWPEFFRIWEEYAIMLSNGLPLNATSAKTQSYCTGFIVSFPHWFISEEYREDLFESIRESCLNRPDVQYKGVGIDGMMASGGGSSFDLENYRGRASQMAVLSRYKDVELPEIPPRLLKLNEDLFGDIYESH